MEFKLTEDRTLFLLRNKQWSKVELKPCFPLTHKQKYFSIRDEEGKELEFLENLDELDEINSKLVESYLNFKSFKFKVQGIYKIEEDFGVRHFEVKTQIGDRNLQTSLENWPKLQKDGSYIIEDIYGDQYLVDKLEFGTKEFSAYIE